MEKQPLIMGILNITPDSFYDGGKHFSEKDMLVHLEKIVKEGASIIDIGGFSSRPNCEIVSEEEEINRVIPVIKTIRKLFPKHKISVDTFRTTVAKESIAAGAHIINDISGGDFDEKMFSVIAKNPNVEYVLMHCGSTTIEGLHKNDPIENIVKDVTGFFAKKMQQLILMGVEAQNIILDPGCGFGKTLQQNYELIRSIPEFVKMGRVLIGISRKSMIYKALKTTSEQALTGTICLNMIALLNGAEIIRVHDVKEAVETLEIFKHYQNIN
ncbi:MAG: dihydropteroate synthase [Bacilli bacterium]|nr:dihydropteroate synthase [Bacilli bacterium]